MPLTPKNLPCPFYQPSTRQKAISVAEKLKAEGRVEGRVEGLWIGKIQTLAEFLGFPFSAGEAIEALSLEELKALQSRLHSEYEARMKRP